jgi:EAL domain-containing protein (putative c-di-GMP-specific phosphodiesterase class I)
MNGSGQTACIGALALAATQQLTPTELLGRAQLALQAAKALGKGQVQLYVEQLGERSRRDALIEQRLRLALQQGSLQLHYQPQVGVADGRVHGFEALLRWQDAELGAVSPALFVPVAERASLMGDIGAWVLERACAQLGSWRDQGFETVVAINLSPLQFRDAQLSEQVLQSLQRHRLPSRSLVVEITESAVMDDPAEAALQLRRLEQAGIDVHLDDFGTGHSSLAWLKNFPIRVIKIDSSFVRDMLVNESDEAIVRAVIGLAHTLRCTVIAEGVEEPGQLTRLRELGCDEYQGWLFSKALPPDAARELAV